MLTTKVHIEGLSDLKTAFEELPKATGKNIMRRVLKRRAEPIAAAAEGAAPVLSGKLKDSISVGTKLSRRQRGTVRNSKSYVEMYVGAGPNPQATLQEFGTSKEKPQPYMRPAWDRYKGSLLSGIREDLWAEISKAAARLAKKAARMGGK